MAKPTIAITMGDPAGIGPELCLRALEAPSLLEKCRPAVFGDAAVLKHAASRCGLRVPQNIAGPDRLDEKLVSLSGPVLVDIGGLDPSLFSPGTVSASCGKASLKYIGEAVKAAMRGIVSGIVTAPVNKEALRAAGCPYAGHTELLGAETGAQETCMMLTSEKLTVSLVTTHLGIDEVPDALTSERIFTVIRLTVDVMRRMLEREPSIAVCGLNPHAGEHGLFGRGEEESIIRPAVERARQEGYNVTGPLPPDTVFIPSRLGTADAVVCMYHDQGLIPVKLLAFSEVVNVTLGLPIVRTSPGHGTAFDIAWQCKADPAGLISAVLTAVKLAV
ncbi:MAG: 4-hydroxythreonine-4-phosphate dehydrogenase PdxA [Kiritimatiellia bacterium]